MSVHRIKRVLLYFRRRRKSESDGGRCRLGCIDTNSFTFGLRSQVLGVGLP